MAALAELQHGVVSRTQLIALGLPSTTIVRWVRVGHLHAVHRGVYSVGHPRLSREGLWMAAVLACGERATLSHIPAARFTHLDRARGRGPIHVTIPRSRRANPRGVRVHRPRRLADVDRMFRGHMPVTTQARTIFDLAAILRPKDLRERFDQAEYLEDLDHERLRNLVTENPNHRGNGELRRLLDMPYVPLASKLDVNGDTATVERDVPGGVEVLEVKLPLALSAAKGMAEQRIPNMRGIMAARTKPLNVEAPAGTDDVGGTVKFQLPPAKGAVKLIPAEEAEKLIELLHTEAKVI